MRVVRQAGGLRESRIRIQREKGDDGLRVLAETVRLEQVIVNLIQNALEAMDDAQIADPRLTLSVARRGGRVEIIVADNGPGLSEEVASTLFTPFTTTKTRGLGLGLVISRDIVAGFGGELDLRPAEQGAAFAIALRAV